MENKGKVWSALADGNRREILQLIQDRELQASEIAGHFDVTRPAISQHLKVLSEAGLVNMRRSGTKRLYRARPEGLADLKAFLDGFWEASLHNLKLAAESEEKGLKYG